MTSDTRVVQLLESTGITQLRRDLKIDDPKYVSWKGYSYRQNPTGMRVVFIKSGPKNIRAVQNMAKQTNLCGIIAFNTKTAGYGILLRTDQKNKLFQLESEAACGRLHDVFKQKEFGTSSFRMEVAIEGVVDTLPKTTTDFVNCGVFSNHYLENRLLKELETVAGDRAKALRSNLGRIGDMLYVLGWSQDISNTDSGKVCVIVSEEQDLSMAQKSGQVAPSYLAVTKLAEHAWVILTNGKSWRLYTDRVSASTTTYFEINLEEPNHSKLLYLAGIFGKDSYSGVESLINRAFDESQRYARALEDDLASKLLRGGIFLNIVKGLLDHDMTAEYTDEHLNDTKNTALKVLYRILFALYAESRDMLPISDEQYHKISIDSLRSVLDSLESDGDGNGCWEHLLNLFSGIRDGDPAHNLPRYNGGLFEYNSYIDGVRVHNRFIVPSLRELLEQDGKSIDYAILEVRHLGSIYERLLEFSVNQAKTDILVHEDSGGGVHIVENHEHPTYKKNDLYLASKEGLVGRKSTASYYTPREIVQVLVRQGLKDMLEEREGFMNQDMKKYRRNLDDDALRKKCVDRLMDIQVLDPAMGSGHFLVEALNQITTWATGVLTRYPDHPLWDEIRQDRNKILDEQKSRNIRMDGNPLTDAILLKRRIMKRCIFGVDINPLAVELARVSLWLDSFAMGTPLTYMGHHIKCGDSTIGMWRDDSRYRDSTLDGFENEFDSARHVEKVSANPDLTIEQVHQSQNESAIYEDETRPYKNRQDVMVVQFMKTKTTFKHAATFAQKVASGWNSKSKDIVDIVRSTKKLRDKHRFFHWKFEMMDAFTDGRDGFDLIVGNPPWAKTKPEDRDFFSRFDHEFYPLKKQEQLKRKKTIMADDPDIKKQYNLYLEKKDEQSKFYSQMYEQQGRGDKDLWQLVLEQCFKMCVQNTGAISMLIPSTILINKGSTDMRKHLLDKNRVVSLYVFENKKEIFSIHRSQRFALLTVRNDGKTDRFPAGFYLYDVESLKDNTREADKFTTIRAKDIRSSMPEQYLIPELAGRTSWDIYLKLHKLEQTLGSGHNGWGIDSSTGLHTTNNSDLFDAKHSPSTAYWPAIKGENIHQFMPNFRVPLHVVRHSDGLEVENKKRAYAGKTRKVFGMFRLAFRNQASDTNARTAITAIIPPHTFIKNSMSFLVLSRTGRRVLDSAELKSYHIEISYLTGVMNSMTFDFMTRAKTLTNPFTVIPTNPLPAASRYDTEIEYLAAKLSVDGTRTFKPFADSMGIPNILLKPGERIETTARLDALVARAYGIDSAEYRTILDSFKFDEDPSMKDRETVDWKASRAKPMNQFFGEVHKLAMSRFEEIRI